MTAHSGSASEVDATDAPTPHDLAAALESLYRQAYPRFLRVARAITDAAADVAV